MIKKRIEQALNKSLDDIQRIDSMRDILLEEDNELVSYIQKAFLSIASDNDDDDLVRVHAAKELSHYPFDSMPDEALRVITDAKEDLDLRINLIGAMEHMGKAVTQKITLLIEPEDELSTYLTK